MTTQKSGVITAVSIHRVIKERKSENFMTLIDN